MEGLILILNEPLLYLCVSLTSLLTAIVASKTLLSYQKFLKPYLKPIKIHLEDWFLFLFTTYLLISVNFPFGCLVVWRWSVGIYMKLRYGRLGDIATGLDSAGSVDIDESRQIIKSLKVLKGKCDIKILRERVEETAWKRDSKTGQLVHPKFHQYLSFCGGYYCWKPSLQFDINHHVRFAPGLDEESESVSESKVLQIISKISNQPFEPKRGLWEIIVIPKFHYDHEDSSSEEEMDEKFAIILKLSHGIGDGFSFLKMIMRDMAGAAAEDYMPPSKPSKSPFWYKVCVFFYVIFKGPRAFYKQMRHKDCNPLHNPKIHVTGEKFHLWSEHLNLEWLKELKERVGAGMTTIFLESLSGACRNYMTQQISLPQSQIPNTFSTIIPVPAPNHPDNKLVNKFSIIMMPLELKTTNILDRCRMIEKQSRILSQSPDSFMNLFLMDLVAPFPYILSKYFILNAQCTSVISNLPGPTKKFSMWGYPVTDTMFWLPNVGRHSGISVSYLSYEDRLRIGIAVDKGVITDGEEGARKLLNWMIEDLKELAESVKLPLEDMFIKKNTSNLRVKQIESRDKIQIFKPEVSLRNEDDSSESSEDYGYEDDNDLSVEEVEYNNNNNDKHKELDSNNNEIVIDSSNPILSINEKDKSSLLKEESSSKKCRCSSCSEHPLIVSQTVRYRCINGGRS